VVKVSRRTESAQPDFHHGLLGQRIEDVETRIGISPTCSALNGERT